MANENDAQVLVNKDDLDKLPKWFSLKSEGYQKDGYDLTQLNNAIGAFDKGW